MSFINTWALIGLIGVPILILIYIIKHRYREEVVPSTFLWKRSLKYMKRRLPFNLKNIILLLLQLMAVALSVLVIARPTIQSTETREVIAIVDNSASMLTVGMDGLTRLDRAKQEIARLADEADEHNPMTVIVAGEKVEVPVNRSGERLYITGKMEEVECQWGGSDIDGAVAEAQKILRENVGARVLYFTDTTYDSLENVETVLMTSGEWNASTQNLAVEQLTNGAFSFTAEVASYGRDSSINAVLYVDGEYVQAKKVDCIDGETTKIAFREYEAVNYDHAEVRLELPEEGDAFSYDNRYLVHKDAETRNRVEVVFASNQYDEFLPVALSAARINYQVVKIDKLTKEGYEDRENGTGGFSPSKIKYSGYSAYIFVGIVPEQMPTDGTTWLMNTPAIPAELGLTLGEQVTDPASRGYTLTPVISSDEEEFAILAGMSFTDESSTLAHDKTVKVLSYRPLSVTLREEGDGATAESDYTYKTLMSCERETGLENVFMVGKNSVNHTRVVVSSMFSSSLTASLEYTLLVDNLIDYACPEILKGGNRIVGDESRLTLPASTIGVEIIRDGTTISMVGRRDYNQKATTTPTDCTISYTDPGDYTIRLHIAYVDQYGEVTSAKQVDYNSYVSLAATENNSYHHLPELTLNIPEDGKAITVPVEIWLYLLIALMVVLMAEWWVYHHA